MQKNLLQTAPCSRNKKISDDYDHRQNKFGNFLVTRTGLLFTTLLCFAPNLTTIDFEFSFTTALVLHLLEILKFQPIYPQPRNIEKEV